MRELQPLRLPQIVEARKLQGSISANDTILSSPHCSADSAPQSPAQSVMPSPTSPSIPMRSHIKIPSCATSPIRESLEGLPSVKRPLTEVREELDMEDGDPVQVGDIPGFVKAVNEKEGIHANANIARDLSDIIHPSTSDYDLRDSYDNAMDIALNPVVKRRRGADLVLTGLTTRFGTRFPSFSHKLKTGKRTPSPSPYADGHREVSLSRANSTRAPSVAGSFKEVNSMVDIQVPPTPTRSVSGEATSPRFGPITPIDVNKANQELEVEDRDVKATTPLLPPVMVGLTSRVDDVPYQSPLQSPTVAGQDSTYSLVTPSMSPVANGLPSPPLSTKPSIASFHRGRGPGPLSPTSEIPVLPLAEVDDPWANKLGHANFDIEPRPYLPDERTAASRQQLVKDWENARQNYLRHLMRTSEHNGTTSKIYRLTEEKWAEVEDQWRAYYEQCEARIGDRDSSGEASQNHASVTALIPITKLPSLNGPHSDGKFPPLGDENIVGPMEQAPSPKAAKPSSKRKRTFLKFLQGMLPTGSGVFGRSSSGERSPI